MTENAIRASEWAELLLPGLLVGGLASASLSGEAPLPRTAVLVSLSPSPRFPGTGSLCWGWKQARPRVFPQRGRTRAPGGAASSGFHSALGFLRDFTLPAVSKCGVYPGDRFQSASWGCVGWSGFLLDAEDQVLGRGLTRRSLSLGSHPRASCPRGPCSCERWRSQCYFPQRGWLPLLFPGQHPSFVCFVPLIIPSGSYVGTSFPCQFSL